MSHYSKYGTENYKPSTACPCNEPQLQRNNFQSYDANRFDEDRECYPQVICEEVFCPDVCYERPQTTMCCVEKPKKSFWQHWFGDKKSICSKKCKCKGKKKQKTKTELICKPCPKEKCKTNTTVCKCTPDPCIYPRRGCFPTSKALCGCHLYFNVENNSKRKSTRQCNCEILDTTDTGIVSSTKYKENGDYYNSRVEKNSIYENVNNSYPETNRDSQLSSATPNERRSEHPSSDKRRVSLSPQTSRDYEPYNSTLATGNRKSSQRGTMKKVCKVIRPSADSRGVSWKAPDCSKGYQPSAEDGSEGYKYTNSKRPSLSSDRRNHSTERKSSSSDDINIGITLTKEKTRYYRNNKGECPSKVAEEVSSNECKALANGKSDESSNDTLTLEIHNNNAKLNINDTNHKQHTSDDIERDFLHSSKVPRSESYKRELKPLIIEKGRQSQFETSEREYDVNFSLENEPKTKVSTTSTAKIKNDNDQKINLDRRVSEILKKLICIEEKINGIEKKKNESKDIRIDIDGQKSTVSFHFSDVGGMKTKPNNDSGDCLNKSINTKGDAVIKIKRKRSRTCSPVRIVPQTEEKASFSLQPLDCNKENKCKKSKIVIKLPNWDNANNKSFIEQTSKNNPGTIEQTRWCEIANNLKLPNPVCKCYCYECLQKQNCTKQ